MPGPRFVITGCGCSGTKWVSNVLTRLGIPCAHESWFHPDNLTDWHGDIVNVAEASWLAVPFLDQIKVPVVRVVRHPLDVLNSAIADGFLGHNRRGVRDPFAEFVYRWRPEIEVASDDPVRHPLLPVERAVLWAADWDTPADHLLTVRIEDGADAIADILDVIGERRQRSVIEAAFTAVAARNTHHRGVNTSRYSRANLLGIPEMWRIDERIDALGYDRRL